MILDRRGFLKTVSCAATAPLLASCNTDGKTVRVPGGPQAGEVELTAGPAPLQLLEGKAPTAAVRYETGVETTVLRAKQGQPFRVRFRNNLEEPTTVHWHGIRLPNGMDGVPFMTQDPVEPGDEFIYEFIPPDAGSFWFHPHYNSLEQMGHGLSGALIVEEAEDPGFDTDLPLVIKDWVVRPDSGKFGKVTSNRGMSRAGTFGNVRTVNNRNNPRYEVPAGGWARLRLINVDVTRVYKIILESEQEIEAKIIAIDGNPIAKPRDFGREHIGPGMRMDLAVRVPEKAGAEFLFRNTSSSKPWVMSRFVSVPRASMQPDKPMPRLAMNPVPAPDLSGAQKLTYRFDSGVGDGYAICGGIHEKMPTFWTINNTPWPEYAVIPPPLDILELGKTYIFELANFTPHAHPIHIHGMTFMVLKSNRRKIAPFHTDTVLLRPDERVQAAFVADNPGNWMFHCHIIEHQVSGMMGHLQVV